MSNDSEELENQEPLQDADLRLREMQAYFRQRLNDLTSELEKAKALLKIERAERLRAEEILQESEERSQAIVQSIDDAYYEVDLAGNLTFFNDVLCRILGYSRDRLTGMNNRDYMTPETAEEVFRVFNRVFTTGKHAEVFDWVVIREDGEKRYLETSVALARDTQGRPRGFRGIARDVTERRRVMREIETLHETKEKFLSHLAHELITPVAVVEASLEHVQKTGALSPDLGRIRRSLDRLKDLQTIAHEITNPFTHRAQSFRADTLTLRVLDDVRSRSAHRHLLISSHPPVLVADHIDPRVYEKVLTVLLKNAVENTPDEGHITVSVEDVPGKGILLRVVDHGVGIPEGDMPFIFKGFYHTQQDGLYSTRRPFDFDAGGKGLELLRLKLLEREGAFRLSFESRRCRHLRMPGEHCPGRVSLCPHVSSEKDCIDSGGTAFSALFFQEREGPRSESG